MTLVEVTGNKMVRDNHLATDLYKALQAAANTTQPVGTWCRVSDLFGIFVYPFFFLNPRIKAVLNLTSVCFL